MPLNARTRASAVFGLAILASAVLGMIVPTQAADMAGMISGVRAARNAGRARRRESVLTEPDPL